LKNRAIEAFELHLTGYVAVHLPTGAAPLQKGLTGITILQGAFIHCPATNFVEKANLHEL
jgi:hypothetical protein